MPPRGPRHEPCRRGRVMASVPTARFAPLARTVSLALVALLALPIAWAQSALPDLAAIDAYVAAEMRAEPGARAPADGAASRTRA